MRCWKEAALGSTLLFSLALGACGGSGGNRGGGSSSPPPPPQPPTQASPGGLFTGLLEGCGAGCPVETTAFVADDGEWFMRFGPFSNNVNWGMLSVDGSSFDGTRLRYGTEAPFGPPRDFGFPPTGPAVLDDPVQTERAVDGTFAERQTLQGTFVFNSQRDTTFDLAYDVQYDRDSSLATLSGMYSAADNSGFTLTYTIGDDGTLSGTDSTGCAVNGTAAVVDPAFNSYRFDVSFTGCGAGAQGPYSGNGTLVDSDAPSGESLLFFVLAEDESLLVVLELPRL